MHALDKIYLKYDEPVWAILRDNPKFKRSGTSGDEPMYDKNVDAPFSAEELAERLRPLSMARCWIAAAPRKARKD